MKDPVNNADLSTNKSKENCISAFLVQNLSKCSKSRDSSRRMYSIWLWIDCRTLTLCLTEHTEHSSVQQVQVVCGMRRGGLLFFLRTLAVYITSVTVDVHCGHTEYNRLLSFVCLIILYVCFINMNNITTMLPYLVIDIKLCNIVIY